MKTSPITTLSGHTLTIWAIALSPDGKILATTSNDKTVHLCNSEGKLIGSLEGHTDSIFCLAWSPDGKILASASTDKTIRLWSIDG